MSIFNDFDSFEQFHSYLEGLHILNEERLRPGWDTYFMVRTIVLWIYDRGVHASYAVLEYP